MARLPFNIWALLFGPVWFYAQAMWTRGSTLVLVLVVALYLASLLGLAPQVPLILVNAFCALTADTYRAAYIKKKEFK